jgi:putative hydrolase of HD superfamily
MSMATDVVDAQIEAYRAKDVERFLSHYADDASVVLFDGTPMFADKQAMREQYGKLFADSPDLHLTVANRMTAGDFVVDEEHLTGMRFGDMPTEMTALSVYRVTNGRITRLMLMF